MFTTFPVAVPPPNVQRLIADCRDRETREIDVMIGKLDGLADQLRTLHRTNLVALGHQLCSPGPSARVGLLLTKRSRAVRPDDGVVTAFRDGRSEEGRVGKEWGRTWRSRGEPDHRNKKTSHAH